MFCKVYRFYNNIVILILSYLIRKHYDVNKFLVFCLNYYFELSITDDTLLFFVTQKFLM